MSEKLDKFWQWIFILVAVIMGLYFRILQPWDGTFINWMDGARLSGNDPWYYFRLIQNCLENFPNRIWFDAFTNYPYGTYIHFGPFLVYFSAILAKLVGASSPESIRSVIAFIPAIGGALLALPTYLFAKEIFNKKVGVIATLLVVTIPGQLLHRSVLSFNDHHVWEVFWTLMTLALFTYSINQGTIIGSKIFSRKTLIFPILAGVALGLYLDTWAPGFILALIIVAFAFLAFLVPKYLEVPETVISTGVITFLVASAVYLPFSFVYPRFNTIYYSLFQLTVLLGSTLVLAIFYAILRLQKRGYYSRLGIKEEFTFPLTILLSAVAVIGVVTMVSPDFLGLLKGVIGVVQPKGGMLTVAEVQPFFIQNGEFSLTNAWFNFSMTFFFAIPGMIYTIYLLIKQRKPLYLLALVWGFAMLIALAGQNRFAYYFGVVSAVFAAVMLDALLRYFKFYDLIIAAINKENALKKVGYTKPIIAIFLIVILFYPTLADANFQSKYSAGGINKQWYDALTWMRNNTPGQEMYDQFYYELYKPNPDLKKPYPYYPEGVYGVMSWWDYGHWITAIAHRIPNANPFQQGIGNKYNHVPGAAPFFTAYNESEANAIADKLGVKYVVSDVEMATGKFYAMAVWAEGTLEKAEKLYYIGPGYVYITPNGQLGISLSRLNIPTGSRVLTVINVPSENYFKTMEAKLHIMDGSGLKHYRMVYESGFESTRSITIEMLYRYIYDTAYAKGDFVPVTSTGYVKIFEYVKGTKITGKVDSSVKEVVISANITTNQNRTFVYKQVSKVIDGKYEFVVPYAQETVYPVKASEYRITAGNETRILSALADDSIEKGETIVIDFV
ncbi:MAG: oligosaccharyl transferase, archaeosortase A system-associated [Archaeoglobus sp.]|nr:oligosaccharyl transferase, archaeosortase A system-associated [Archaeoglobus sp.]